MKFIPSPNKTLLFKVLIGIFLFLPFISFGGPVGAETKEPGSPQEIIALTPPPDTEIEERIKAIFSRVDQFKSIDVDVEQSVVTLSGDIGNAKAEESAVNVAGRIEGVVYVVNEMSVKTEVESRLTPAIRKVKQALIKFMAYLPIIVVALAVVIFFWLVAVLITRWDTPFERLGINSLLHSLARQLIRLIITLIGVLLALEILDLTAILGALVGAAGIFGLALGFAFRDIVENYLAGILLSIRSPFTVKDWVAIGPDEGSVIRMTSRELVLMTLDGNHIRIPNSQVFKSVIYNFTRNPLRRFIFTVGIGATENLSHVLKIGSQALAGMKGVLRDPAPSMIVHELADYNVLVRFFGWVDQREFDFLKVESEAKRILKSAFDDAGIQMPQPTQTINMRRILPDRQLAVSEEIKQDEPYPDNIDKEASQADVDREKFLDLQISQDELASPDENLLKNQDTRRKK